jgi:hypothetical protein
MGQEIVRAAQTGVLLRWMCTDDQALGPITITWFCSL